VKPDEIFILLLIVVSMGIIAAAAFHSRRGGETPDAEDPQIKDETVTSPSSGVVEERAEPAISD
jgi:hypothetical protein